MRALVLALLRGAQSRISAVRYQVMDARHPLFDDYAARVNALLEESARTTQAARPSGR